MIVPAYRLKLPRTGDAQKCVACRLKDISPTKGMSLLRQNDQFCSEESKKRLTVRNLNHQLIQSAVADPRFRVSGRQQGGKISE